MAMVYEDATSGVGMRDFKILDGLNAKARQVGRKSQTATTMKLRSSIHFYEHEGGGRSGNGCCLYSRRNVG